MKSGFPALHRDNRGIDASEGMGGVAGELTECR
jgi:hypothetical protein